MQDPLSEPLHLVLRRARQAANLRQTALAQQVGCTQSALSMFEGGRASALSAETVRKVAETLGVELPASFPAADAPVGCSFPPSGPAFPAFFAPSVVEVLTRDYGVKPIDTPEADAEAMMAGN